MTILVVEDEAVALLAIRRYLEGRGHTTIGAATAEAAVARE